MARAKRTDRAEARRQYRAYLQAKAEAEGAGGEEDFAPVAQKSVRASRPDAAPVLRPGQKVGFMSAFRLATRPVHYIDDLRYAPTLILRTNAIWPPAVISIGALAYGLTITDYKNGSIQFLLNFALPMIPLIQPMLAGFLAPRATWLAGLIAGLISGICFEILFIWYTSGHLTNLPTDVKLSASDYIPFTAQVFLTALTFGSLLGAGSGWYKRFLSLAAPASPKTQQRSGSSKPSARRPAARR